MVSLGLVLVLVLVLLCGLSSAVKPSPFPGNNIYKYIGCVKPSNDYSFEYHYSDRNLTPESCLAKCNKKRFPFAALESGTKVHIIQGLVLVVLLCSLMHNLQCLCGTKLCPETIAEPSQCTFACSGNR